MRKLSYLLILVTFLNMPLALAGYEYQYDSPRMVKQGQFESEVTAKLGRGVTNVLFGWTEIFRTPIRVAEPANDGIMKAIFWGIPLGIARFVGRTLVGVYEIATFYAPQEPIMAPIEGDVV